MKQETIKAKLSYALWGCRDKELTFRKRLRQIVRFILPAGDKQGGNDTRGVVMGPPSYFYLLLLGIMSFTISPEEGYQPQKYYYGIISFLAICTKFKSKKCHSGG